MLETMQNYENKLCKTHESKLCKLCSHESYLNEMTILKSYNDLHFTATKIKNEVYSFPKLQNSRYLMLQHLLFTTRLTFFLQIDSWCIETSSTSTFFLLTVYPFSPLFYHIYNHRIIQLNLYIVNKFSLHKIKFYFSLGTIKGNSVTLGIMSKSSIY